MLHSITASDFYNYSRSFVEAYATVMQPLTETFHMPQSSVDILLFLANNPEHYTARDICEYRHLKPSIVSQQVDRLVKEGYLTRTEIPGDRRKYRLTCTDLAIPLIKSGRHLQKKMAESMTTGLTEDDLLHFSRCLCTFKENLTAIAQTSTKDIIEKK